MESNNPDYNQNLNNAQNNNNIENEEIIIENVVNDINIDDINSINIDNELRSNNIENENRNNINNFNIDTDIDMSDNINNNIDDVNNNEPSNNNNSPVIDENLILNTSVNMLNIIRNILDEPNSQNTTFNNLIDNLSRDLVNSTNETIPSLLNEQINNNEEENNEEENSGGINSLLNELGNALMGNESVESMEVESNSNNNIENTNSEQQAIDIPMLENDYIDLIQTGNLERQLRSSRYSNVRNNQSEEEPTEEQLATAVTNHDFQYALMLQQQEYRLSTPSRSFEHVINNMLQGNRPRTLRPIRRNGLNTHYSSRQVNIPPTNVPPTNVPQANVPQANVPQSSSNLASSLGSNVAPNPNNNNNNTNIGTNTEISSSRLISPSILGRSRISLEARDGSLRIRRRSLSPRSSSGQNNSSRPAPIDTTERMMLSFLNEHSGLHNSTIRNFRNVLAGFMTGPQQRTMDNVPVVLEEKQIDELRKVKYTPACKEEGNYTKCTICLGPFENDEILTILPCNHGFHSECINNWLKDYSYKCPICRNATGKGKPIINNRNN